MELSQSQFAEIVPLFASFCLVRSIRCGCKTSENLL